MKTAKDYIDFLVQRGYSSAGNQFICGYLEYTDLEKKDTLGHVTLFTRYTEEYTKELESLPEGTEFEIDFSRVEVTGAWFKTLITYPEKTNSFCDEGTGIIVEGKEFEDNFEKVLWISENPTEHELGTIRSHYRNLEYFMKNFKPILMKYDFYECYDSFWDTTERHSSAPRFDYRHINTRSDFDIDFIFTTNPITGSLECNAPSKLFGDKSKDLCSLSPKEFEKYLIEDYFSGDLKFEYILSSDPRYTKDSYIEIMKLMFSLRYMKDGTGQVYKDIDFEKIPEKYNDLIRDYNEKG